MSNNETTLSPLVDMREKAYNGYAIYRDDFKKLKRVYDGEIDEIKVRDLIHRKKSVIKTKEAKSLVKRLVSGLTDAYFGNESLANIAPSTTVSETLAIKCQRAFDFYWKKTGMRPYMPMKKNFLDASIYGTTIAKVYWANSMVKMEYVNVHNIYFDPSSASIEDTGYVVHKIYQTASDVRKHKKNKVYNKNFKLSDIKYTSTSDTEWNTFDNTIEMSRIPLYDVYVKENGKWTVSTMYDDRILLREKVELKDGLPFFVGSIFPRTIDPDTQEVRLYEDSVVADVLELQEEATIRTNQEIDAIAEILNPSYFTEPGSGLQEGKLKKGSSKVIQVTDLTKIQKLGDAPIHILNSSYDRIYESMKKTTGIDVFINPDNSALLNRQSTDNMEKISGEQNIRMDDYITQFNETFIEPMASHMMKLIFKYNKYPHVLTDVDKTQNINFTVTINAGLGATSKNLKLQALDSLFQKFMALGDTEKANLTIRDSLPLIGIKNTTDYYPDFDDEEAKEEQAKQRQMDAQKQQEAFELEKAKAQAELEEMQAKTRATIEELKIKTQQLQIDASKNDANTEIGMGKIRNKDRELDLKELELENYMKKGFNNG